MNKSLDFNRRLTILIYVEGNFYNKINIKIKYMTNATNADFIFTATKEGRRTVVLFLLMGALQNFIDYYLAEGWKVDAQLK